MIASAAATMIFGALALLLPAFAFAAPALIPYPASVQPAAGSFVVDAASGVVAPAGDAGAAFAARELARRVARDRGLTLHVGEGAAGAITFLRDTSAPAGEGYTLEVTSRGVAIRAQSDPGLLYGAATLAQLLSPDAHYGRPVTLAAMTIQDAPRFAWRGLMLDVARHFQSIDSVKTIVDAMAELKLDVLHLHLSDDQGWRLEIKRYPKLTQIGAWRTPPSAGGPPGGSYGGFYTQAQIRDLVAYAAARAITIVPEFDMPGHAQAAVAAYPEIGVFGDRPVVSNDWGVNPYLFNVDDTSLNFIKGVLDEVMALFPGTFIHVGGDEAIKDQWIRAPAVQAKIEALGLKDERGMQSWFIDQLGEYLAAHGRRLIGWDEILEGGLPASASVMSWRGEQGAIDAARQGHDVVLAPAPTLYLDSCQSRRDDEPPCRLSTVSLADIYAYDPMPKELDAPHAAHVLGAEATAFSEYLVTAEQLQHAAFPRLDAFAEVAWSPKAARDFASFTARLQPQRQRHAHAGIAAADSAFAVDFTAPHGVGGGLRAGAVELAMATQAGFGDIRYTVDGSLPTAASTAYRAPISVPVGGVVHAAAFDAAGAALAAPRAFDAHALALLTRTGGQISACPKGALGLRVPLSSEAVVDKPAFNVNLFDTCTIYPAAPLDRVVGFVAHLVRLPRHYGLAHDLEKVIWHYSATRFGEFVVRTGGCDGPVAATFPLPDPAASSNRMTFEGGLPLGPGNSDLCLLFTAPIAGPFYAVETMALTPRPGG